MNRYRIPGLLNVFKKAPVPLLKFGVAIQGQFGKHVVVFEKTFCKPTQMPRSPEIEENNPSLPGQAEQLGDLGGMALRHVFSFDHLDWIVTENILNGCIAKYRNIGAYGEMMKLIVPWRIGDELSEPMVVQHEHGTVGNG